MSVLIFLHFFIKLIYPFLEILFGIFHVRKMFSLICLGCIQNFFMSRICLVYMYKFQTWKNSGHHIWSFWDIFWTYLNISGQIPDISMMFFWCFFFIGLGFQTNPKEILLKLSYYKIKDLIHEYKRVLMKYQISVHKLVSRFWPLLI